MGRPLYVRSQGLTLCPCYIKAAIVEAASTSQTIGKPAKTLKKNNQN